ncbi:glycoside hydrolase family 85 protein [Periconia macrospinosa]|uniref:Glycoside hydrolase family 85 protein n=1 Tax=Periconia macrospinosa TaxID=97972 RepID=A0A2V1EGY9_9PLEO|nr:glycoside hydrolase family 85 protein [Periconia macrospinosa]
MIISTGWKDILRPIRDGYRHLFPSPDTGPTPEEREKQRELDRLKGFAYFDTFDQLETWSEIDADPLQRSNTPLLVKSRPTGPETEQKAATILCHDYSGNYHEYEAVQGEGVEGESYTCEYLQYVEKFVYFSHKLVCLPPPSWTNTLHRNGVQALGTILIEPQTKDSDRLLGKTQSGDNLELEFTFPIAKKLADIAQHYGFDGYLVNIEKPFSKQIWDPQVLRSFLCQLKENLGPNCSLIWYDALTIENKVVYQNALTTKNAIFGQACGEVLTNYSWRESDALSSKEVALTHGGLSADRVFFGIDTWAQNSAPLTRRRITYPEAKGGGTYCGIAVEKLSEIGLSAGIFAPAWTFEHFPGKGRVMEQAVWEGTPFPEVSCSCGHAHTQHPPNEGRYITKYAKDFPAGSDCFFYTNFSRGFGRHAHLEADRLFDGRPIHSQLASQSILPHYLERNMNGGGAASPHVLSYHLEDMVGLTQLVVNLQTAAPQKESQVESYGEFWLTLFSLDMSTDQALYLNVVYKVFLQAPGILMSFFLKFENGMSFVPCTQGNTIECPIQLGDGTKKYGRLQEIGLRLQATYISDKPLRAMEVQSIRIGPQHDTKLAGGSGIHDIKVVKNRSPNGIYWRLRWAYLHNTETDSLLSGMPYSAISGPFSHFLVRVDGLNVGVAHALEFILPNSLMKNWTGDEMSIELVGVGFDGRELASKSTTISREFVTE